MKTHTRKEECGWYFSPGGDELSNFCDEWTNNYPAMRLWKEVGIHPFGNNNNNNDNIEKKKKSFEEWEKKQSRWEIKTLSNIRMESSQCVHDLPNYLSSRGVGELQPGKSRFFLFFFFERWLWKVDNFGRKNARQS